MSSVATIPLAPPAPPLPLALDQLPVIRYSVLDQIDAVSKSEPTKVMIACLGVEWLFMSISYTKQIINFEKQTSFQGKVQFFYVDEEVERDFCESEGLLVGSAALMFWIAGSRVVFQRPGWDPSSIVVGPLQDSNIDSIAKQILDQSTAINENPRFVIKLTL